MENEKKTPTVSLENKETDNDQAWHKRASAARMIATVLAVVAATAIALAIVVGYYVGLHK
jgi:hypothetical protein